MLYLAFIFHMHQPYYKNLLTQEMLLPWVRLHGTKDYLDMVKILKKYSKIRQTFNLVPSLLEQLEDYVEERVSDKFLALSYKPAKDLGIQEKKFILDNFFAIDRHRVISIHPRYYELYLKKQRKIELQSVDYLDLQVWFNLVWIDPHLRQTPELKNLLKKGRFFTEEEKQLVLNRQKEILKEILPAYKTFAEKNQIEITVSPYYHPILPLLYNTKIAKEANPQSILPQIQFIYPDDARAQIVEAVNFGKEKFGIAPEGMWPSEEGVSEHILPFLIQAGMKWIVTDEAILFKSLKKKKRDTSLLYQAHLLKREEGDLNIVFRDRNLSDLIGFVYSKWSAEDAVNDFMRHLENIQRFFKEQDILVTVAMDGENAWEYYLNDGWDFLELLYERLSESKIIRTTTVSEYLKMHPPKAEIKRLSAGSWIYAEFSKWINHPYKNKAWEYLTRARQELENLKPNLPSEKLNLALKQIFIAEGSDWFWWYGENQEEFDRLFRLHLANFYTILNKEIPPYLNKPISA